MSSKILSKPEKRRTISSFFITVLIGLAYAEMIPPLKDSIAVSDSFKWQSLLLPSTFFFVSMRFFIGNQLHLLSPALEELKGSLWLYDIMVIVVQSVVLIFMAGTASIEASRGSYIGFVEMLLILYVVDVLWISSQWVLGLAFPSWKRTFVPTAWAILNSLLIMGILLLSLLPGDVYGDLALVALLVLNILAFVVDVVLIDYHDAI